MILGIDPGAEHVGWAMLTDALVHVEAGVLEGLTPRAVVAAVRRLVGLMHACRVVGVERVDQVNARAGFGSTMATGLCLGHGVGQRIVQALEDDGVAVREVTAETWHLAYFERRAVDAQAVKALVQSRIADWPTKSNGHARDAACVALWAAETPW